MVIVFWVSEPGNAVFPKMCSTDPKEFAIGSKESATGSQGNRDYIPRNPRQDPKETATGFQGTRDLIPKNPRPDPKESATGSQVIRGFISVMATLKFTYSLKVINFFFK